MSRAVLVAVGVILITAGVGFAAAGFFAPRPEGPRAVAATASVNASHATTSGSAATDRSPTPPVQPATGSVATADTTAPPQIERTSFPQEMRRCLDRKAAISPFERASPPPAVLTACADEVDRAASFVEGLTEVGIATPDQAQCLHDAILGLDDAQVADLMLAIASTADSAPPPPIRSLFDRCGVDGATQ